ncbi:MAG TPA: peptidoglycan editing factor PgeF [Steroidobacteraceae bacterium]|nr:peptidoglycan editing factor PgeF [Steroidobacteraceae bacterium]
MSTPVAGARLAILVPQWPAPHAVHAAFTLRDGGVSTGPYKSLNLGAHVGDADAAVAENRRRVAAHLNLPAEPAWIEQVHSIGVLDPDAATDATTHATTPATAAASPPALPLSHSPPCADASIARRAGRVCVVQVADCLPVLFAARDAAAVAAAHAGWRGLAAGVLEATVAQLGIDPAQLIAWLGPAIGAEHFEVGGEVRELFMTHDRAAAAAFAANARGRWQCDLGKLARQRLTALGVGAVYGGGWCTFSDPLRFFSHRRDGRCGRMAALVWLGEGTC